MGASGARLLGALFGIALTAGAVLYFRLRKPPCTGGVTVELRPPLIEPGPYRFAIALDGAQVPCEFEVPLPVKGRVPTPCGLALALQTRVVEGRTSITGLTIGAAPESLVFTAARGGEKLYHAELTPRYGPYETPREEDRRFCGERALVTPACVRGSSGCAPYLPSCNGPEECSDGRACCLSPDAAREYGPAAASGCSSARACLNRFGFIACQRDQDCPKDMSCGDREISSEFRRPVQSCRARARAR